MSSATFFSPSAFKSISSTSAPLFLQSNISNLIAAAQRLIPLGHKKSTNILKDLFEKINEISKIVLVSGEKDLFSSCYLADTCTLLHEEFQGKIFKS